MKKPSLKKIAIRKPNLKLKKINRSKRFDTALLLFTPIFILLALFIYIMDKTSPTNETPSTSNQIPNNQSENIADDQTSNDTQSVIDVTELQIEDLTIGTGDEAQSGDTLSVHYRGTLLDGTPFDNSYDRGEPFEFTLGAGGVIEGWDQGLVGMKVGGKRKLTIPSTMGYGETGSGSIPPSAALVFEVELVEIVQ